MELKKRIRFKRGSYVYIEGEEEAESVYIVESGELEFKWINERIVGHKTNIKAGDIFGFISALCNRPRMESVLARTECVVVQLHRDSFLNMLQKNSEIALKVINYFAEELRTYDEMIFSLRDLEDDEPPEIEMYHMGEYYYRRQMYDMASYMFSRYAELYPHGSYGSESLKYSTALAEKFPKKEPIKDGLNRTYSDKQVIFCEGEPGKELFIIQDGKIKILKYHEGTEVMLSVLKKGDIFGELAIVSDKPRNATAISFGLTKLMALDKKSLVSLMGKSPEILKKIFGSISQRIWFTFIRLEARLYEKPITRVYAFLEYKLIEDNISLKSNDAHVFHFGIDELLKMNSLTHGQMGSSLSELLKDPNLDFNLGQIVVDKPSAVSSKARYFKSRDHLSSQVSPDAGGPEAAGPEAGGPEAAGPEAESSKEAGPGSDDSFDIDDSMTFDETKAMFTEEEPEKEEKAGSGQQKSSELFAEMFDDVFSDGKNNKK